MPRTILVFDLETCLDKAAIARVYGLDEGNNEWAASVIGDKFPPLIFHQIICIGALRAIQIDGMWSVEALGAPHSGERDERALISDFVASIENRRPRLVSFNGSTFDLPVLRYRGGLLRVFAPGLHQLNYFHRYGDAAIDLCDVLSAYDGRAKVGLDTLCRAWGIPGKLSDIDGAKVAAYAEVGRLPDIANYCERDVVSTYKVWLVHELFSGRLTPHGFAASEAALSEYIAGRSGKAHLHDFIVPNSYHEL